MTVRAPHVIVASVSMGRTHSHATATQVSLGTCARHRSTSVRATLASLEDTVRTSLMATSAAASQAPRALTVRSTSMSVTAIHVATVQNV
jgi:hypothetical protein